jgi:hypothetical protein
MPNWLFWICLVAFFSLCLIAPWKTKRLEAFVRSFDAPDRALAYFALFIGFQILLQQTTGFAYGFVHMVSNEKAREVISNSGSLYSSFAEESTLMAVFYWLLAAGALFALSALIRGTIRDIKRHDEADLSKVVRLLESIDKKLK